MKLGGCLYTIAVLLLVLTVAFYVRKVIHSASWLGRSYIVLIFIGVIYLGTYVIQKMRSKDE